MDTSYIINEFAEDREHYFNAVSPPICKPAILCLEKWMICARPLQMNTVLFYTAVARIPP
jgi:hypothetical protein